MHWDELYHVKNPSIVIKSGRESGQIFFSVADNGRGIQPEIIDKIFDPFFTSKPKNREKGSKEPIGTGLGLHFCKNSIESCGGKIAVSSQLEQGTEFKIFFPAVAAELVAN